MSDQPTGRPLRPQYGEYASPEEQRARIRLPDATRALETGQVPEAPPASSVAPTPRSRTVDRIITFALLGYGLFSVLTSIPAVVDYPLFASTFLALFGVDQPLADPAGARAWGLAAALVLGVGWVATLGFSWVSVRAGRLSFWIPLVGGVVFNAIFSVLIVVPLMADTAVWNALQDALLGQAG